MEPHPPTHPSPPSRPADRRTFQIAIFCALPLEATAIKAIFDQLWTPDSNAYTTGVVGRHNVVLVHLSGMGKAIAAAAAADCIRDFPCIKLALVVGICGCVPFGSRRRDILLGDVVIGEGVVQYDLGRRFPDRLVRKNTVLESLGKPGNEIRTFLARLKSDPAFEASAARHLEGLCHKPGLACSYPGAAHDKLFDAAYRHKHQAATCAMCAACHEKTDPACDGAVDLSCDELGCDEANLLPRSRLETAQASSHVPVVHYGVFASGDSVMRSGEERDEIAKTEGVIGFEMEAAGVWQRFPGNTVVIKGACDYADSHKSKMWQRHAAAAAAACARAFLSCWTPEPIRDTEPPEPWFLVPYPKNESYVGRDHILEKLRRLAADGALAHARAALYGLGGIGKTQVALEYAYWVRDNRPGTSVFWVHASNAERFSQSMLSIAQKCKIPGHEDPKANAAQLVKAWLERTDQRQWLMVLDNADDVDMLFSPGNLSCYIPTSPQGIIILTTRNKQVGVRFAKTKRKSVIEVGKMSDDEAGELLREGIDDDLDADDTSALSSRLESIPLALVQASAFIQENSLGVGRYLKLLNESDGRVVDMLSEDFEADGRDWDGRDSDTSHAVAATWILSFEQIAEQLPLAADILSVMSHYDRQNIPMAFILTFAKILHEPWDNTRVEEMPGSMQVEKALGRLKAFSFVGEGVDGKLNMHRLVQLVTRRWLVNKGRYEEFAAKALVSVSKNYPFGNYKNWGICADYLPHASSVLNLKGNLSEEDLLFRGSLLHCVAGYLLHQGQWKAAKGYQKEAVEIRERVLGAKHPSTLTSMGNLASTYRNQGRWKEAEDLDVEVMEIRKRVLGAEHPDTLTSMANLASTFWNQGRWKEAENLDVEVMKTRKRVLGVEHPSTLTSMANLASTYRNQGRWKEAEDLEVEVMEISKKVLGAEHPDTLTSMANLASTFWNQGRWKEAEDLNVQVIKTRKRVLGAEHPDTLTSINNLASTYRNQGRWKEAKDLDVEVMEIRKKVLGAEHPDTLTSMANLALTLWNQGRWKEAENLNVEVIKTSKRVLGAEHPLTLTSIANLASTYRNQGRWKEAEDLEVEVMETRKRVLGAEHPDTLTSMANLASTFWNQSRWKEAENLDVEVIKTCKRVLGAEHPDTLTSINNLASTYKNQGRWKEAEDLDVEVMEIRKRVLGAEHPDTLTSMANLASIFWNQSRWKEAEDLFMEVMETRRRVLGAEHPDTLTSMNNLAFTWYSLGRTEEAISLMDECVRGQTSRLGSGHHLTVSLMSALTNWRIECLDVDQGPDS